MPSSEHCPSSCQHESFHYCNESGTHCDKHCICTCDQCIRDSDDPGPNDPKMGGRILPGSTVIVLD